MACEREVLGSLRVSPFEIVQLVQLSFFFFLPVLRLFVDQHDREKARDSCVGTAARRKAQLEILAPERDRLEVCGEIRQTQRGERRERGRKDHRGAERFRHG